MLTTGLQFTRFAPGDSTVSRLLGLLTRLSSRFTPDLESHVKLDVYARKLAQSAEVIFAHVDDHDVGVVAFYANDRKTHSGYLSSIVVAAEHEARGIASSLLKEALEVSTNRGMNRLRLAVSVRNSRALEFYLRKGFRVVTRQENQADGSDVPVLLLECTCGAAPRLIPERAKADDSGEGRPVSPTLHVGGPNIGDRTRLLERFNDILDRRWFTNNGPLVKEFELRIAEFLGVKHCVAICNATVALEIACRALDLKGEVIMPAYTFAATAHAFQWQEVRPRFADIDPLTHNIDPESVESLITPQTSAIVGVHVWGRACDTTALEAIGRRHELTVLYDAAHAFGCTHAGRMIGGFGRCEVFSFHATKFLNSFEGGAVTTNDDALAEKLRLMRNFGFTGVDRVAHLGVNGKMTEVCAAMGITSLEAIDELVATNRSNYEAYHAELTGLPGLTVLRYSEQEKSNFQYVVVEIDSANCPRDREELVAVLQRENILARKYFWPGCHRMEPYRSRPEGIPTLPATERVAARVMILPTGQAVNMNAVKRIGRILRGALT